MTLRELREAAGLTQEEAAAKTTTLHQTTISQLELGKVPEPRHSTLKALAAIYNVPVEDVARALAESIRDSEAA